MSAVTDDITAPTGSHSAGAGDPLPPSGLRGASRRELLLVALGLAVLGFATYADHIIHGGFYLDDWANAALTLQNPGGGLGSVLSDYWDTTGYRPMLVLYVPLTHWVFGTHMTLHLVYAVVLAISVSLTLYGILRELRLARWHAVAIAALVLVYPWFDSIRMWSTASMAAFAITLTFGGVWAALAGLRRGSWRLHGLAVVCYVLAILTYEVALAFILSAGLLYVLVFGWRRAGRRWAADLVGAGSAALWVATQSPRDQQYDLVGHFEHLRAIIDQGAGLLARTALPVGPERQTLVLVLLGALGLCALTLGWPGRGQAGDPAMRRWAQLFAGGLAVAALGWVMFVPAHPYYTPSTMGFTNRVNALAGVGLVMLVYASLGVVGSLAGRVSRRVRSVPIVLTTILALALGGIYVGVVDRHSQKWNDAFDAEMAGLGQMKAQFPELPRGAVVYPTNHPAYQAPGVPIFSATWDVNNAIRLQYDDPSLQAYPLMPGLALECRSDGLLMTGPGLEGTPVAPYGLAYLLNIATGDSAVPRDIRACRRDVTRFAPGPYQVENGY